MRKVTPLGIRVSCQMETTGREGRKEEEEEEEERTEGGKGEIHYAGEVEGGCGRRAIDGIYTYEWKRQRVGSAWQRCATASQLGEERRSGGLAGRWQNKSGGRKRR